MLLFRIANYFFVGPMSAIYAESRDVALARVQALNALEQDFQAAVRIAASDLGLDRSSVRRWAHKKFGVQPGDADPVPAQMVGADSIKTATLYLLQEYEIAGGKSPDDYSEAPRVHPMAEGKYLSSLAALQRTGTIKNITENIRQSLARLERTAVPQHTGIAWGLGFPFRGAPSDEPYVITTCIVTTGLMDVMEVMDGDDRNRLAGLARDALTWLMGGARRKSWGGIEVPTFSHSIPEVVFNVVAQWSHVLTRAQKLNLFLPNSETQTGDHRRAATAVLDQFRPNVGWTYSDLSTRLDLLHTCYIGSALLCALPNQRDHIDRALLVATTQFLSPHGWFDRFDVIEADEAVARPWPWNGRAHKFLDEAVLLGFDRPARPWSLGELLVLAASSAEGGSTSKFWTTQLRPVATLAVGRYLGTKQFRHSMHLAHGLAAVLEALRRGRKASNG